MLATATLSADGSNRPAAGLHVVPAFAKASVYTKVTTRQVGVAGSDVATSRSEVKDRGQISEVGASELRSLR